MGNNHLKFIVTGATSCIGTACVKYLLEKGHNVCAVMRENSKREKLFKAQLANVPQEKLNITYLEFEKYEILKNKADIFLNFAWAGTTQEGRNSTELQNSNVVNALNTMKIAANLGCKVYVEAGSQAEYGWQNGDITKETSQCEPYSEYGKAKLKCWLIGKELAQTLNISYIHLRIFSVYGETESDTAILPYCIRQMLTGKSIELSKCTQKWNFLYRHDAAQMICRLAEVHYCKDSPQIELYNIASNDTRILKDFINEFTDVCEQKPHIIYGAINSSKLLSLNPSIKKVIDTIGEMIFTPFSNGLKKEINYIKEYDKSK